MTSTAAQMLGLPPAATAAMRLVAMNRLVLDAQKHAEAAERGRALKLAQCVRACTAPALALDSASALALALDSAFALRV
jgi:hypothetical protein